MSNKITYDAYIDAKRIVAEYEKKQAESEEAEPVVIGHLNKNFGYNGYEPIPKGAPVFELRDRYFFEMTLIKDGSKHRQKFYKETLREAIDFIA